MEIVERKETKTKPTPRTIAIPTTSQTMSEEVTKKPVVAIGEPCEEKAEALKTSPTTLKNAASNAGTAMKTMFTKRKKVLIVASMVALLCVTVYFNFALNTGDAPPAGAQVQTCMFTTFRNNRANERTRDIMVYENLVATSQNATTVAAAEARLLEIRANVAFENNAEGLIMAALGFSDIIVNRTNGFVNVLVRRPENITRTQAVLIMSTLQTIQPGLDIDSVHISMMS